MYKEIIQSNLRVIYEREPTFKASIDAAFHKGMSYTEALEIAVVSLSSVISRQNDKAIGVAVKSGGFEEAHHKDWVIDQMVRSLSGDNYNKIVQEACSGEDGPNTYVWNKGVAP